MRLRVLASPASLHDPSSPSARLVTRKRSSRPALHRPFHFLRSSDSHRNNSQSTVLASPSSMILGKRASHGMSSSFMLGPDDYDSNDIWGEDEVSDLIANGFSSDSLVLEREWERRHNQFHTIGYRDGITVGEEASAQGGFNDGYKESVHAGYCWGLVRGISSAISNFPDLLKEKLTSNQANKDRFLVLSESTRAISSNNALQIFYRSLQQNGSENSNVLVEDCSGSQFETHFSELNHLLNNSPKIKVDLDLLKESAN